MWFDSFNDPFSTALPQVMAPHAPRIRPLNEAETTSALQTLGQRVVGGLSYVGGSLDKAFGGRAIRGLLGGRSREALSILPFSDALGLTDPTESVSGMELFGVNPEDAGLGQHALGIGAELALDPATYLTFGGSALSKLGLAAKKAGALPGTMSGRIRGLAAGTPEAAALASHLAVPEADVVGRSLGGLAGLRLPFTEASTAVGTGPTARSVADALGSIWDKAVYSRPGRVTSALFDPNVNIAGKAPMSEAGQRAARAQQGNLRKAETGARALVTKYGHQLDDMGLLDYGTELRSALEGTAAVRPEFAPMVAEMRSQLDAWKDAARGIGRDTGDLVDRFIDYFPRQKTPLEPKTAAARKAAKQGKIFETQSPNQLRRMDELRDLPRGTEAINQIVMDAAARPQPGNSVKAAAHVRHTYLGGSYADDAQRAALQIKNPPPEIPGPVAGKMVPNPDFVRLTELNRIHDQSHQLASFAGAQPAERVTDQLKLFANHPVSDLSAYALKHERAQAATNAVHDMLAATVSDMVSPNSKPLLEVLERAGLKEQLHGAGGAQTTLLKRLLGNFKLAPGSTVQDLSRFHVPGEIIDDVIRYADGFNFPSVMQPVLEGWDSYTNLLKGHLAGSLLGPAFHSRNALTGAFMNWIGGARDARFGALDPRSWFTPFADSIAARSGKLIPGSNQIRGLTGKTEQEATRLLLDEMHNHAVRPGIGSLVNEIASISDHAAGDAGKLKLPGEPGETLVGILKQGMPSTVAQANPLNLRGVGGRLEDTFAPVAAGRKLAELVDDQNRISAYLAYRRQGFEPEMAAARAKAIHYDYTRLTPFERQVMRRAIPFYSWIRQNIPAMVNQLATEPGGKLAAAIRATGDARNIDAEGFMPPQIGEGLAIPVGSEDETGRRRFITNLGLPFEDAFDLLGAGTNPLQRSLQKAISMLNPLIKGPIEVAAGRQMHSGRELEDLYARTGSSTADQIIMNSPASRLLTTLGTLTDVRKGASGIATNLLGPGRISDVQMDRARNVAAREVIEQTLQSNPNFRIFDRLQIRPEAATNLTPQELTLMRLYQTLEQEARQRAQQGRMGQTMNFPIPR